MSPRHSDFLQNWLIILSLHTYSESARIVPMPALLRNEVQRKMEIISYREIKIDMERADVTVNGNNISLTKIEYKFLLYFVFNKKRVVSMDSLAEYVWKDEAQLHCSFDAIYTHIRNLRKKLEYAGGMDYLHSIYGIGYEFS